MKKKYIINELKNNFKIVYKKNTYRYNYNTPKVSDLTILYIKKYLNPNLHA